MSEWHDGQQMRIMSSTSQCRLVREILTGKNIIAFWFQNYQCIWIICLVYKAAHMLSSIWISPDKEGLWVITLTIPAARTSFPLFTFLLMYRMKLKLHTHCNKYLTWKWTFGSHLWTRFMSEPTEVLQRKSVNRTVRNRHVLGSMIHPFNSNSWLG